MERISSQIAAAQHVSYRLLNFIPLISFPGLVTCSLAIPLMNNEDIITIHPFLIDQITCNIIAPFSSEPTPPQFSAFERGCPCRLV